MEKTYKMPSKEGELKVAKLVLAVIHMPLATSNEEVYEKLKKGINEIANNGYPEVQEDHVKKNIIDQITNLTNRNLNTDGLKN